MGDEVDSVGEVEVGGGIIVVAVNLLLIGCR
jgi:hypothetical protein